MEAKSMETKNIPARRKAILLPNKVLIDCNEAFDIIYHEGDNYSYVGTSEGIAYYVMMSTTLSPLSLLFPVSANRDLHEAPAKTSLSLLLPEFAKSEVSDSQDPDSTSDSQDPDLQNPPDLRLQVKISRFPDSELKVTYWVSSEYHCPNCGEQTVWTEDSGGGDYYLGENYVCLVCSSIFYLSIGEAERVVEQIKKAVEELATDSIRSTQV